MPLPVLIVISCHCPPGPTFLPEASEFFPPSRTFPHYSAIPSPYLPPKSFSHPFCRIALVKQNTLGVTLISFPFG